MVQNPLLSIVITSYTTERLKDIYELFDSIKNQTYKNIEVIFVAECSRELYEKAKEYGEKIELPRFKILFNKGQQGACAARNLGIANAQGEIIGFVDDDAVFFPDWAEEMVKTYKDETVIGVTGPAYPKWQEKFVPWLPEEFYWLISCTNWCSWNEIREVRNIWAMNASLRREAFDFGGFATYLGPQKGGIQGWKKKLPEEIELSLRIKERTGKRIVYNPKSKVNHKIYSYKLKIKYMIQCAYLMGFSKSKMKKVYSKFQNQDILIQEKQLLKRIFRRLLLKMIRQMFKDPALTWQRFLITVIVLLSIAIGYLAGTMTRA